MWWHTGKNIISNMTAYYRSICKIGSRKVDKNVEISVLYNHIWDYHFSGAVIKNEMRNEMEHITDVWSKNEIRVREKGREREKSAKCLLSNERLSMMSKLFALHKNVVCVWNDAIGHSLHSCMYSAISSRKCETNQNQLNTILHEYI